MGSKEENEELLWYQGNNCRVEKSVKSVFVISSFYSVSTLTYVKVYAHKFFILCFHFLITWMYKILENVFVKCIFFNSRFRSRSSTPEMFLDGDVLKLCSKFIEHPCQGPCKKYTVAWVLSCNFAAYFQNIFS